MPLITHLERKIGWIAVPGLIRIIMSFQVLVYVLLQVQFARSGSAEIESFGDLPGLIQLLYLDSDRVLHGEVWRLFSFVLLPPILSIKGIIYMVFAFFFTCFLGNLLEGIWGSFRTTLYIIGWWAGTVLADFVTPGCGFYYLISGRGGLMFFSVLLFAVAVYLPNLEIRLLGVIPIKMFWLAIFDGGIVALEVLKHLPDLPRMSVSVLLSVGVFFVVFGPGMKRALKMRADTAVRRHRFESAKMSTKDAMHECATCGKTENDDADLVFRVAADGEEYCDVCRNKS